MTSVSENHLLQMSHPLEDVAPHTPEDYVLMLIHRKAYQEAATRLKPGGRVLDCGCNDGYGLEIMSKSSPEIVGLDLSEEALEAARRRFNGRVELVLYDGHKAPLPDASFDMITSFQCIEHVVDYETYLSDIRRLLKPGGIALFSTPNAHIRLYPGMKPWREFHVREFQHWELKELLTSYFGHVEVHGMKGCKEIAKIELRRCDFARRRARSALQKLLVKAIWTSRGLSHRSMPDCSTEHLFYSTEDLDNSLDFMAVCVHC